MQLKFEQSIIDRVNDNWLTKENAIEFENCQTDSDRCLTFVRVSNMTGDEQMLAGTIANDATIQIFKNRK